MRSLCLMVAVVGALLPACGTGSAGDTRQVLVDYNFDRFAAVSVAYFPAKVEVHPGQTVRFRQTWSGEPHSVTMGALVDRALTAFDPVLPKLAGGSPDDPDVNAHFKNDFVNVPFMTDFPDNTRVVQAGARPCYIDDGVPPSNIDTPCSNRPQPRFNGRQSFYSSGYIPYGGSRSNEFTVKLAHDIRPGAYRFFCTYHGPSMQGQLVVKPSRERVPSQADVDRAAQADAAAHFAAANRAFEGATTGPWDLFRAARLAGFEMPPPEVADQVRHDYLAGYAAAGAAVGSNPFFGINEFLPRKITARVGEKVTWLFVGSHTVSFNVPTYFPQLNIDKSGRVFFDHRADVPVNGPGFPKDAPPDLPKLWVTDGGTWAGQGFRSSGLPPQQAVTSNNLIGFSVAFARAGSYQYACLIHPRMVGTVVVS